MLPTIQLYAEVQFLTVEIQHIGRHRVLAAKLAPSQLTTAQMTPEQRLGIGSRTSQLASEFKLIGVERGFMARHGRSPFLMVRVA